MVACRNVLRHVKMEGELSGGTALGNMSAETPVHD